MHRTQHGSAVHRLTCSIALLLLVPLVLPARPGFCQSSAARHTEVTAMPSDQLTGWIGIDFAGIDKSLSLSVVTVNEQAQKGSALQLRSERLTGSLPVAAAMVPITDFATITFDVWSEKDTLLAVGFEDVDKASFHAARTLNAGVWQRITLTPSDFEVNDDSPVKKPKVEPLKLRSGVVIADLGGLLGKTGANSLRIAGFRVESAPMDVVTLPAVLDGKTLEITTNSIIRGNTYVANGGSIKISAPRVILEGNVAVVKGSFEVSGSVCTLKARFPHERAFVAGEGSTIRFDNCSMVSPLIAGLQVTKGGRLEIRNTAVDPFGFTVGLDTGSSADIRGMKQFGEFIVNQGVDFKVRDSGTFLMWLTPTSPQQIDFRLPSDPTIANWSLPQESGFNIGLHNCTGVLWGVISMPGTKVKMIDSQLIAVGTVFMGDTKQTITGIRNKQPATKLKLDVSDRTLEFQGCTVGAWNFYAFGSSKITLKDCTAGETFSSEKAVMLVDSCTVDGSGGYIKANGESRMRMVKCKATCTLVAENTAQLSLENCEVVGPVTATGSATIKLTNTTVNGPISQLETGRVIVDKP